MKIYIVMYKYIKSRIRKFCTFEVFLSKYWAQWHPRWDLLKFLPNWRLCNISFKCNEHLFSYILYVSRVLVFSFPPPMMRNCNMWNFKLLTRDLMCALFSLEDMSQWERGTRGAAKPVYHTCRYVCMHFGWHFLL